MAATALVLINRNKKEVDVTRSDSIDTLIVRIEDTFQLEKGSISHLQIWTEKFDDYKDVEKFEEVQNGCRINAVLTTRKPVFVPTPVPPEAEEALPDCNKPTVNVCQTCFEQDHQEVVPQDQRAGTAGGICPHNKLWNKTVLKVCFLNPIETSWSWTYSGSKYPVSGGKRGHMIDTSDILTLANLWNTKLPPFIPLERKEKVPAFVPVLTAMDSDIRVWFQKPGQSCTKVGTDAETVPKGEKEENATMWLDLTGDDRYKEYLVMHEFGHALGLNHEHQQAFFWNNIGKFLKEEEMTKYFGTQYKRDVKTNEDLGTGSDYDADSVMHYWFDSDWLKTEYDTKEKVEQHRGITDEERKALIGFFERKNKGLAVEISSIDHSFIADTYYEHRTFTTTPTANDSLGSGSGSGPDQPPLQPAAPSHGVRIELSPSHNNTLCDVVAYNGWNMWHNIGNYLGLSEVNLEAILEKNQSNVVRHCFRDMLLKWFEDSPCYLDTFLSALRSDTVGLDTLYLKVEKAILKIEGDNDRKRSAQQMNGALGDQGNGGQQSAKKARK